MISPSDNDYKDTKLIKQGKKEMKDLFKELAEWIDKQFDVSVLNIYYDLIDSNKRPRLNIILDYSKDEEKFRSKNLVYYADKQKVVADKFREMTKHGDIGKNKFWSKLFNGKSSPIYNADNIWVIFSSFERVAKEEANNSIPKEKITELKQRYCKKNLWEISRCSYATTFFFYTDEQIKENTKNGTTTKLTEEYYNLLKLYDEFDYFKKEQYLANFDSKENFDNNYQSNWYYYYH